jgi:hypothetical protein
MFNLKLKPLFVFLLVAPVFEASGSGVVEVNGGRYAITNRKSKTCKTCKLVGVTAQLQNGLVFIPASVKVGNIGYSVTELADKVFERPAVQKVSIPNSVEKIGKACFANCQSLTEVTFIGDSKLNEIGAGAFEYTGLKIITIPNSVEKIGISCFIGCKSLTEVTFEGGSKLKEIGAMAFIRAELKNITIPSSVE